VTDAHSFGNLSRRALLGHGLGAGGVLALAALAPAAVQARTAPGPVVRTREGSLRGVTSAKLHIFKGIRYGESSAGTGRFRKPVPVRPWRGIRPATQLGAPTIQDNVDTPPFQDPRPQSEDCLFLNVWAPRTAGSHPVMVFFHGGAFGWGSGGVPMYDGAALAERGDVVVVAINHRLNVFGYLYLAGLSSHYAGEGNPGHLDLVEGLRWVRRNIAAFGGDPGNVTIFGESGGGAKVSLMLATPQAEGLFHKAIVQSGSLLRIRTPDVATAEAAALLKELSIDPGAVDTIARLPVEAIMRAYRTVRDRSMGEGWLALPFAPVLDPATIPLQPEEYRSRERWKDGPLLLGTTSEEIVFLMAIEGGVPDPKSDQNVVAALVAAPVGLAPERAQRLVAAARTVYPGASPRQLLVQVRSFDFFRGRAVRQAELKAELGGAQAYMYEFGWKEPCYGGEWAIHAADLPFVFDKLDSSPLYDESDTVRLRAQRDPGGLRYRLRDGMMDAWTSFARTGRPEARSLPEWPPYTAPDRAVMYLDGTSRVKHDPYGAQLRALAQG
jgi:para-nitrobenzyl esterase